MSWVKKDKSWVTGSLRTPHSPTMASDLLDGYHASLPRPPFSVSIYFESLARGSLIWDETTLIETSKNMGTQSGSHGQLCTMLS